MLSAAMRGDLTSASATTGASWIDTPAKARKTTALAATTMAAARWLTTFTCASASQVNTGVATATATGGMSLRSDRGRGLCPSRPRDWRKAKVSTST